MKLEYSKQKEHLLILLDGRLDANNAQQLEKALDEAINIGEYHLVLDMNKVSYLSSGGMRLLIKYQQILKKINGTLIIRSPTPIVQNILGLAGLLNIFMPSGKAPEEQKKSTGEEQHHIIKNVSFSIYKNNEPREMQCFLRGYPELLKNGTMLEYPSENLKCQDDFFAIGMGMLGNNPSELKQRCGEYLSVSGMVAHQSGDNGGLPDYMYRVGDFQPSVQSAYSIEMSGDFAYCLRFEARDENISLSSLLQIISNLLKSESLGMVMLAHTEGLVGASLSAPLSDKDDLFAFPEVRKKIFFTTEPFASQKMALACGIAMGGEYSRCAPFVRPLGKNIHGHFHAAVFDRRLFPHGRLELHRAVNNLISEQSPFKVLHLINDNRELTGVGESRFSQGAIWVSPLNSIIRKHTNGIIGVRS